MFRRYLKNSVWSFLVCCVMSWSLAQMCFLGFYVEAEQQYNAPLLFAIVVVLNVILWLVSFGKRTMAGGVAGFLAAIVLALVYLRVSGNMLTAFTDTADETNPYIYYMICFVVIVGVWLLAATWRGTLVLMAAGALVSALIQYLYHNNQVLWLLLFLAACMVGLALKNYQKQVLHHGNQRISFGRTALVALVCVAVALVIGCGAFYGIVSPLNPPARKIELFTHDMSQTVLDRVGLASEAKVLDPNLTSDETAEVAGAGGSSSQTPDSSEGGTSGDDIEEDAEQDNARNSYDPVEEPEVDTIRYDLPHQTLWNTILALAILIAAAIVLKVLSHRFWLKRIQQKPLKEQISAMYHLFLRKFRQIKEGKNIEETPCEYASRAGVNLASFVTPQADFHEITDIFVRSGYGTDEVSAEDYRKYVDYYRNIFRCLRRYLGLRWIIKFFIL